MTWCDDNPANGPQRKKKSKSLLALKACALLVRKTPKDRLIAFAAAMSQHKCCPCRQMFCLPIRQVELSRYCSKVSVLKVCRIASSDHDQAHFCPAHANFWEIFSARGCCKSSLKSSTILLVFMHCTTSHVFKRLSSNVQPVR